MLKSKTHGMSTRWSLETFTFTETMKQQLLGSTDDRYLSLVPVTSDKWNIEMTSGFVAGCYDFWKVLPWIYVG